MFSQTKALDKGPDTGQTNGRGGNRQKRGRKFGSGGDSVLGIEAEKGVQQREKKDAGHKGHSPTVCFTLETGGSGLRPFQWGNNSKGSKMRIERCQLTKKMVKTVGGGKKG